MNKKISMDDITRDLQISKSTISFIINGKAKEMRISDSWPPKYWIMLKKHEGAILF